MREIPERDWKIIRKLKDDILNLTCQRILDKATAIIGATDKTTHARYLEMYKMIHDEDRHIGDMFNNLRRSSAFFQVSLWKRYGLLSDEQFALFSEETRDVLSSIADY